MFTRNTLCAVALPRVGPEYGLALVKGAQTAATDLMLYILSLDGQTTLKHFGFNPVGLPTPSEP
jgi:hypothetical protein